MPEQVKARWGCEYTENCIIKSKAEHGECKKNTFNTNLTAQRWG